MAGIVSAISAVTSIVTSFIDADTTDKKELSKLILKNVQDSTLIRTDGSITKLLTKYTVEPVIIATKGTKDIEVIDKILEVNTDIFSSFYMQAFDILSGVMRIDHEVAVDLLATDNGGLTRFTLAGVDKVVSMESFTDNTYLGRLLADNNIGLSIEAIGDKPKNSSDLRREPIKADNRYDKMIDQPLYKILQRNLNITLNLKTDSTSEYGSNVRTHTIIMPITIKAHVIFTTLDNVINLLSPNAADKTFSVRLDEYRAGAISLSDLVFATDLIRKYKDNKLKDKEDLLNITQNRIRSANSKILDSKAVGFEKNYNMLVVTAEDKVRLDKHVRGDINGEKYKQDLLEQANAMTITIIDQDYERCYILTRDIRGRSDVTFKVLNNRKDKGVDMSEIMKAMMTNRPPVF